ncbi:MAG: leucine-rich repeat domain-containing protein, partial [Sulfurimonas sp.]|nr:leucine-rich repeat domain-containing protein [Sulfurimonas sp.]
NIEALQGLIHLTVLFLSDNQITNIEALQGLTHLTNLHLSINKITNIDALKGLTHLKELYMFGNQITNIDALKGLSHLTKLHLSDNQISELSQVQDMIKKLKNLQELRIYNNPFEKELGDTQLDSEFDENNLDDLKNYFKLLTANDAEEISLIQKVMLVGNHGVGKSTFLHYFLNDVLPKRRKKSTHILSLEHYPKESIEPQAIFYDFGGQDYYHGIYKAFMTNRDSLNLIFWQEKIDKNEVGDDKNPTSGTQNFSRSYWIKQLEHYKHTDKSWLIQTHLDTDSRKALTDNKLQELIEDEYHVTIHNPIKANLIALKEGLKEKIESRKKVTISKEYIDFKNEYILNEESPNATSVTELEAKYANRAKIDFRAELAQLSRQGLILYYPHIKQLEDSVWLNPQATVKMIHTDILSKVFMKNSQGIVSKAKFEKIAKDEKIRLMLVENRVIYLDETTQEYIIPSYLPRAEEKREEFFYFFDFAMPTLTLKFEYFIPFGFINQLVCNYGEMPEVKKYWRDMLMFTTDKKQTKILIKLDFTALKIEIFVSSLLESRSVTEISKNIFDDIIAFYNDVQGYKSKLLAQQKQLQEEKEKRYPDDMYISLNNKHFVHYNTLNNEEKTKESIIAYTLNEDLNIDKESAIMLSTRQFAYIAPENKGLKNMKKIFISYSKKDFEYTEHLVKHLQLLKLYSIADNWHDGRLNETGGEWDIAIQKELEDSDMIIYMLSINFYNSAYILNKEVANIMKKQKESKKKILCVLVSHFADLYQLSINATDSKNQDTKESDELLHGLISLGKYQVAPYGISHNTINAQDEKSPMPLSHWEPRQIDEAYAQIINTVRTMLTSDKK